VGEVEWLAIIRSDREVKRSCLHLRDCCELGGAGVLLSD